MRVYTLIIVLDLTIDRGTSSLLVVISYPLLVNGKRRSAVVDRRYRSAQ
jgi:hypothetical protein